MKRVLCLTIVFLLCAAPATLCAAPPAPVVNESKAPRFLYVLSAEKGSYKNGKLKLDGVAPLVVYFSDRPQRIAGHMSVEKLLDIWGKGPDSFKADPPNATLSIFDESGNKNIVLELQNPDLSDGKLTFDVRLLEGRLPPSFRASSLFIDMNFVLGVGQWDYEKFGIPYQDPVLGDEGIGDNGYSRPFEP